MDNETHRREPAEYAPPGQEYASPGREYANPGLEQQPEDPAGNTYTAPQQKKRRRERENLLRTLLLGAATIMIAAVAVANPDLRWQDPGTELIQAKPMPAATPALAAGLTAEPMTEPTPKLSTMPTEESARFDTEQNYFEQNGLTVFDAMPDNVPVTFITISKDDNTVYTLWDTGKLTGFKQTVTDSEHEGYKTVTMQADLNLRYQVDASTENDHYITYGVQLYDFYTGRELPARTTWKDDGYGYSFDLQIGEEIYTIYADATVRWYDSAWMPQEDGTKEKTKRVRFKYVLQVPREYDGLVLCNYPMTANTAANVGKNVIQMEEVDYTERYVLDNLSPDALDKALFVRFGQGSAIS